MLCRECRPLHSTPSSREGALGSGVQGGAAAAPDTRAGLALDSSVLCMARVMRCASYSGTGASTDNATQGGSLAQELSRTMPHRELSRRAWLLGLRRLGHAMRVSGLTSCSLGSASAAQPPRAATSASKWLCMVDSTARTCAIGTEKVFTDSKVRSQLHAVTSLDIEQVAPSCESALGENATARCLVRCVMCVQQHRCYYAWWNIA